MTLGKNKIQADQLKRHLEKIERGNLEAWSRIAIALFDEFFGGAAEWKIQMEGITCDVLSEPWKFKRDAKDFFESCIYCLESGIVMRRWRSYYDSKSRAITKSRAEC